MRHEVKPYIESAEVAAARAANQPVIALESTILSEGLPYPKNLQSAQQIAQAVRDNGATPAMITILSGKLHIGLEEAELDLLARASVGSIQRVSRNNFPIVMATGSHGATTIAGTMVGAQIAGLDLVATGAIGGVHIGNPFDISADLTELARTPVTVVCSGMKPFLDLANTRETLETYGVTVVGLDNDDVAPFFTQHSGLQVDLKADSHSDVAAVIKQQRHLGLQQAALVAVAVPAAFRVDMPTFTGVVRRLVAEAYEENVAGSDVTNWMVRKLVREIGPEAFEGTTELLSHNAAMAALIGKALID